MLQESVTGTYPELGECGPHHPVSLRSMLVLFSHVFSSLPNGLFPSYLPTKI